MRCLTRPGRVALVSSRTLGHFFVSSPLCSGRGGFMPCKHLDLLVRWSDLYVTSVKIQETHRNRYHFYETLYIFYIFCYPFYHVSPFSKVGKWRDRLLRRFFPSKVGGRPAWLGDSVSQDGLTQGLELISWCYSLIMWIYMSVYGCIYIYVYVYLVWYIYIYIHTYIYIYTIIHMYVFIILSMNQKTNTKTIRLAGWFRKTSRRGSTVWGRPSGQHSAPWSILREQKPMGDGGNSILLYI